MKKTLLLLGLMLILTACDGGNKTPTEDKKEEVTDSNKINGTENKTKANDLIKLTADKVKNNGTVKVEKDKVLDITILSSKPDIVAGILVSYEDGDPEFIKSEFDGNGELHLNFDHTKVQSNLKFDLFVNEIEVDGEKLSVRKEANPDFSFYVVAPETSNAGTNNDEFDNHINGIDWADINNTLKEEFSIKENHPHIIETDFDIDTKKKQITIAAIIDPAMPESDLQELPDTLVRRFSWWVNFKDNYFTQPSSESLGGIYKNMKTIIGITTPGKTNDVKDFLYFEAISSDNPKLLKKASY